MSKIVEDNAVKSDFGAQISGMCRDNLKLTKKLAKIFIKAINSSSTEKMAIYLKALKNFLLIDDQYQQHRLEWVLGVPQLKTANAYKSIKFQYGVELVERIGDTAYNFVSPLTGNTTTNYCLLEKVIQQRGRLDDFCIKVVKELMSLSIKSPVIAKYIYNLPPNCYQYSRYCDWFKEYIDN